MFTVHTPQTAPADSVRLLEATRRHLGHLPTAVGLMAESPEMLGTFLKASAAFEASTLDPLAQEVVVLTMATRNGCDLCVAMHTARLTAQEADPEIITALQTSAVLKDDKLEVLRQFTLQLLATTGEVGDDDLETFLAAGYTTRNALEVVLGIGAYTMSTFANRLVRAPIDGPFSVR